MKSRNSIIMMMTSSVVLLLITASMCEGTATTSRLRHFFENLSDVNATSLESRNVIEIECDEVCRWMDQDLASSNVSDLLGTSPDLEGVDPAIFGENGRPDAIESYFDGRHKREIFLQDTRFSLALPKYSRVFPFSSVVYLTVGCSGTLLSPLHVLTAASCFHDGTHYVKSARKSLVGMYSENPVNRPGYAGRSSRSQPGDQMVWTGIRKISMPKIWQQRRGASPPMQNYALVTLREKLGSRFMSLGLNRLTNRPVGRIHFSAFKFAPNTSLSAKQAKSVIAESSSLAKLMYRHCKIEKQVSQFLFHTCDAEDTALGSGIYMTFYNSTTRRRSRRIIGIYTGSTRLRNRLINQSVRMTPYKIYQICVWMNDGDRSSCGHPAINRSRRFTARKPSASLRMKMRNRRRKILYRRRHKH